MGYGAAQSPAIGIRNYYDDPAIGSDITEGIIYNSVISGNLETEIVMDTIQNFSGQLNFDIQHCCVNELVSLPQWLVFVRNPPSCIHKSHEACQRAKYLEIGLGNGSMHPAPKRRDSHIDQGRLF